MIVKLRIDLDAWAKANNTTLHAIARRAGIAHSTLYSITKGASLPGNTAIAGLLRATKLPFKTLFEIHNK